MAVTVNLNGRRKVLDMAVGHSKAQPFWVEFMRDPARRGLRGVRPVAELVPWSFGFGAPDQGARQTA